MERSNNNKSQSIDQWHRWHGQQDCPSVKTKDAPPPSARRRPAGQAPRHHSERMLRKEADGLIEDWPKRRSSSCGPTNNARDRQQSLRLERPRRQLRDETRTSRAPEAKRVVVTFSKTSDLYTYPPFDDVRAMDDNNRKEFYTGRDFKSFRSEARSDAARIRLEITSSSSSSQSSQSGKQSTHEYDYESVLGLLKEDILSIEEMIGIEHYIFSKSGSGGTSKNDLGRFESKERRDHARAVLSKQYRMRKESAGTKKRNPHHRGRDDDGTAAAELTQGRYSMADELGEFAGSRSIGSVRKARFRAALAA